MRSKDGQLRVVKSEFLRLYVTRGVTKFLFNSGNITVRAHVEKKTRDPPQPLKTAGTPILNVGFKTATLQRTICTRIR